MTRLIIPAPEVDLSKADTPERPPKVDLTTPDAFEDDISLLQSFEFRGTINALSEAAA